MMGGSWRLVKVKSRGGEDRRGNAEKGYSETDEDETLAELERVRYFHEKMRQPLFFPHFHWKPSTEGGKKSRREPS